MNRAALERLSKDDLIALVLALSERVAALEAAPGNPPKTPDNSSVPPSRGEKANRPERSKKPRPGRPGVTRTLAEAPDHTVEAFATACPHCRHDLTPADQPDVHAYDHLDLPPIKPVVTRVNRHRGVCPGCRTGFSAPVPEGLEPRHSVPRSSP